MVVGWDVGDVVQPFSLGPVTRKAREKGRSRSAEECQAYNNMRAMSNDSGVWGRATRRPTGPAKRLGGPARMPGQRRGEGVKGRD